MAMHEITNSGFVRADNSSMTKPKNYDKTGIDNFVNISVKTHLYLNLFLF